MGTYIFVIMFMAYLPMREIENRVRRYSMAQYSRRSSTLSIQGGGDQAQDRRPSSFLKQANQDRRPSSLLQQAHQDRRSSSFLQQAQDRRPSLLRLQRQQTARENRRSRIILEQGILYSMIPFIVHIFPCIQYFYYMTTDQKSYVLLLLTYFFHPVQGFYNAVVYYHLKRSNSRSNRREERRCMRRSGTLFDTCIFSSALKAGVAKLSNLSVTMTNSFMGTKRRDGNESSQEANDTTEDYGQDEEEEGRQGRQVERKDEEEKEPAAEMTFPLPELAESNGKNKEGKKMNVEELLKMTVVDDNETNSNFVLEGDRIELEYITHSDDDNDHTIHIIPPEEENDQDETSEQEGDLEDFYLVNTKSE